MNHYDGPSPLTLLLPVKPGKYLELAAMFDTLLPLLQLEIPKIGTIHYMRTLFLDRSSPNLQKQNLLGTDGDMVVAIITEFDGSFGAYIGDFADKLAPFFNELLKFVVGSEVVGDPPDVRKNTQAFIDFLQANNASKDNFPKMWCAYPYTVQQILAAKVPASTGAPWPGDTTSESVAEA